MNFLQTKKMDEPKRKLSILKATIREHALKLAIKDWKTIYEPNLLELLGAAGLFKEFKTTMNNYGVLELDTGKIPVESLINALRSAFEKQRSKELVKALSDQVVTEAFKKIESED
jgi:hypothetical protein